MSKNYRILRNINYYFVFQIGYSVFWGAIADRCWKSLTGIMLFITTTMIAFLWTGYLMNRYIVYRDKDIKLWILVLCMGVSSCAVLLG